MTVTFRELFLDSDSSLRAAGYSYTTTPLTPNPGKLYLLANYQTATGTSTGDIALVDGWGLTWTKVIASSEVSQTRNVVIYMATGTPNTADDVQVTVPPGSEYSQIMTWMYEVDGVDLANPIVQTESGRPGGGAVVSINDNFNTPPAVGNGGFALVAVSSNQGGFGPGAGIEPGAGWTESEWTETGPTHNGDVLYASQCPAAITATWPVGANAFYVGCEIKAAVGGGPANLDDLRYAAGTIGMRYGAAAVDAAYYGSTKVWP